MRGPMEEENCRQPTELGRVNINDPPELLYWCNHFNCTDAEDRAAVTAVGFMAWDVHAYLQSKKAPVRDDRTILVRGCEVQTP
jgi:hypothetical protein